MFGPFGVVRRSGPCFRRIYPRVFHGIYAIWQVGCEHTIFTILSCSCLCAVCFETRGRNRSTCPKGFKCKAFQPEKPLSMDFPLDSGVSVLGLGALNKAEWINQGGEDVLKALPSLKLR